MLEKLKKIFDAPNKLSAIWLFISCILTFILFFSSAFEIITISEQIYFGIFILIELICLILYAHHVSKK